MKNPIREYMIQNPPRGVESMMQYFRDVADKKGWGVSNVKAAWYRTSPKVRELLNPMVQSKKTVDKRGNPTHTTYKREPQTPEHKVEGFELERFTTDVNSNRVWARYKKPNIDLAETIERLRDELTKDIEPYEIPISPNKGCDMVIYSSDKHFGAHTDVNSVYQNVYNPEVFRERHDKLLDKIYTESKRFGGFRNLVYMDLGDAADGWNGETTRKGHKLPQNLDNAGQWEHFVIEHKRAFDKIADMNPASNYQFIGASNSNHGGDFDYILMRTLAMYIEAKFPRWETQVSRKPFDHFELGDHSVIYGHGKDSTDMKFGFPLNLNDKTENWINDYIDQKELTGIIHFVAGDQHQSAHNYGKRFRYRRVMSLYGSSKWIHTNFGSGRPGVSYDIIDGNQVYSMDLIL